MNSNKLLYVPSKTDSLWEGASISILISIICYTIFSYSNLPEQIPTHFNIQGEADGFGSRNTIWVIVAISIVLYFFLGWIRQFGHSFNYPVKITEQTKQKQFNNSMQLLIRVRAIIMILFLVLIWFMIDPLRIEAMNLSMLPIFIIGVLFIFIIKYTWESFAIAGKSS